MHLVFIIGTVAVGGVGWGSLLGNDAGVVGVGSEI